jgi:hypothetical protein
MANELQKMLGGDGCDIVTAANGAFTARIGRIYAIVVREDSTTIESVTEDIEGTDNVVTSRGWVGGESSDAYVSLKQFDFIVPDYPLSSIEVGAGSVIVYYLKKGWQKT